MTRPFSDHPGWGLLTESDRARLDGLHPELVWRSLELIVRMDERGYKIVPRSTIRTAEEQQKHHDEGRAQTDRSWHRNGHAIDFYIRKPDGTVDTKAEDRVAYNALGEEAEALGLTWGGRWKTLDDPFHVELSEGLDWDEEGWRHVERVGEARAEADGLIKDLDPAKRPKPPQEPVQVTEAPAQPEAAPEEPAQPEAAPEEPSPQKPIQTPLGPWMRTVPGTVIPDVRKRPGIDDRPEEAGPVPQPEGVRGHPLLNIRDPFGLSETPTEYDARLEEDRGYASEEDTVSVEEALARADSQALPEGSSYVRNKTSGTIYTMDAQDTQNALADHEKWERVDPREMAEIFLISPSGEPYSMTYADAQNALQDGWRMPTWKEQQAIEEELKLTSGVKGFGLAAARAAADVPTLGGVSRAAGALDPEYGRRARALKEEQPIGTLVGDVGGVFLGGAPTLGAKAGGAAGRVFSPFATRALQEAGRGAALGVSRTLTDETLSEDPWSKEVFFSELSRNMLWGGIAGGVLGGIGHGLRRGMNVGARAGRGATGKLGKFAQGLRDAKHPKMVGKPGDIMTRHQVALRTHPGVEEALRKGAEGTIRLPHGTTMHYHALPKSVQKSLARGEVARPGLLALKAPGEKRSLIEQWQTYWLFNKMGSKLGTGPVLTMSLARSIAQKTRFLAEKVAEKMQHLVHGKLSRPAHVARAGVKAITRKGAGAHKAIRIGEAWDRDAASTRRLSIEEEAEVVRTITEPRESGEGYRVTEAAKREIDQTLEPLARDAPEAADEIKSMIIRSIEFVAGKLPKEPQVPHLPHRRGKIKLNKLEQRRLQRLFDLMDDPFGAVGKATALKLTPGEVDAMEKMYPHLLEVMRMGIIAAMSDWEGGAMPYPVQLQVSIIMGQPMTPALHPQILAFLQNQHEDDESQMGGMTGPPGPAAGFGEPTPGQMRAGEKLELWPP